MGNRKRNELMILLSVNHGLRSCELLSLTPANFDLKRDRLRVIRAKNSRICNHQLIGKREKKLVHELCAGLERDDYIFHAIDKPYKYLDLTAFNALLKSLAKKAGIKINIHSHMLRHTCAYVLINECNKTLEDIAHWLGQKSVNSALIYAEMNIKKCDDIGAYIGQCTKASGDY